MATANIVAVLLLTVCLSNGGVSSKDCSYQFTQQPDSELKCNPVGSQLQLHCGVTGPRFPTITLEWYVSSFDMINSKDNSLKLSTLPEYKIRSVAFDFVGDMRSMSSILLTKTISSGDSGQCFYCQIEFHNGLKLSHTSNTLCIEREEYYKELLGVTPCSNGETIIVDTSVQCVNISDALAPGFKHSETIKSLHELSITTTSKTNDQEQPTIEINTPTEQLSIVEDMVIPTTTFTTSITVGMVIPTTATCTNRNTPPKASQRFTTFFSAAVLSKTQTQSMATHSPKMSVSLLDTLSTSITQNCTNSSMEDTIPRSTFEAALYSAILVCIVFVVVIAILIAVVLCCSKSRYSFLKKIGITGLREVAILRPRTRGATEGGNRCCSHQQLGVCAVNRRSDTDSQGMSRAASLQIGSPDLPLQPLPDRDIPDGFKERKQLDSFMEKHFAKWRLPLNRQVSNIENHAHPHPPRPRRADTLPSRNYDHLELKATENAQKPVDAHCSTHDQSIEGSLITSREFARNKHSRSQSADNHYYYTLEKSENNSPPLTQSAAEGQGSSSRANGLGHQHVQSCRDKTSRCLKDLFDEPQYVSMVVNTQDVEEERVLMNGLTNRQHFSRSSPSIVTLLQPAPKIQHVVSERRSLYLPKWLQSTAKTSEIFDN